MHARGMDTWKSAIVREANRASANHGGARASTSALNCMGAQTQEAMPIKHKHLAPCFTFELGMTRASSRKVSKLHTEY